MNSSSARLTGDLPGSVRWALLLWCTAAIVYLSLLLRPFERLISRPLLEEAFYSLLAPRGHDAAGLRQWLLLQILFFALASIAIGACLQQADRGRRPTVALWAAALVFCNYTLSTVFLSGLESGLVALLVFSTQYAYVRWTACGSPLTLIQTAALAALFLGCAFVREDASLYAASLAVWHALAPASQSGSRCEARARWMGSALLMFAAVAAVVAAAGFEAVRTSSPASATSPILFFEARPLSRWIATLRVISHQCFGIVHLPTHHDHFGTSNIAGLAMMSAVASTILILPTFRRHAAKAIATWRRRWSLRVLGPVWIYSAALLVGYTLHWSVPHLQGHYLVVPRLVMLFVTVSLGIEFLSGWYARRFLTPAVVALWGAISLGLRARDFAGATGNHLLPAVEWIRRNTTPPDRVGLFQSGLASYLLADRVVDLSGHQEPSVARLVRAGTLSAFLEARRVRYLVDHRACLALAWRDSTVAGRARLVEVLPGEIEVWSVLEREP